MTRIPRRPRRRGLVFLRSTGRAVRQLHEALLLALVALALSVLLWLVVTTEQNPTVVGDVTVPVRLINAPAGLVAYSSAVGPVDVRASAPQDVWARVSTDTFRATVNLADAQEGDQELRVRVESLNNLVTVIQPRPAFVTVRLEQIERKTVPVQVEVSGNLPFGYAHGKPEVTPPRVTVSGPAPLVRQVQRVRATFRVDGSRVTVSRQGELVVPVNSDGSPIRDEALTTEPKTVSINVPIDQQIAYRTVPVNATITNTVPTGYWLAGITVNPAAVTISGPAGTIEGINFVQTAPIDVSGLITRAVRSAEVVLPGGTSLIGDQTVAVGVEVNPLQGSQTFPVAVQPLNLGPTLTANTTPVRVTLAGELPRLGTLLSSQIVATTDASGLEPGDYTRDVRVIAPAGFQIVSVTPSWTRVYIQAQ